MPDGDTFRSPAALAAAALLLAAGLLGAGWFVGRGLIEIRTADRYVTVKGIAERDVTADLAIWPLRFLATSNDLAEAQAKIVADTRTVRRFLEDRGIPAEAIAVDSMAVTDLLAQQYRSGPIESRFIVTGGVTVRTAGVAALDAASREAAALVDAGVVLDNQGSFGGGPSYLFTGLTDIKPEMIAEATANARRGAEQFAADSGAAVGGIRTAHQGLFQILARDDAPGVTETGEILKTVRVVSTIDYYLIE